MIRNHKLLAIPAVAALGLVTACGAGEAQPPSTEDITPPAATGSTPTPTPDPGPPTNKRGNYEVSVGETIAVGSPVVWKGTITELSVIECAGQYASTETAVRIDATVQTQDVPADSPGLGLATPFNITAFSYYDAERGTTEPVTTMVLGCLEGNVSTGFGSLAPNSTYESTVLLPTEKLPEDGALIYRPSGSAHGYEWELPK